MKKVIKTIQTEHKMLFDGLINLYLEIGWDLEPNSYNIINEKYYSQVVSKKITKDFKVFYNKNNEIEFLINIKDETVYNFKNYDDNNGKIIKMSMKNGKAHGKFIMHEFSKDGFSKTSKNFVNGELDGLYEQCNEFGEHFKGEYKNGKKEGKWLERTTELIYKNNLKQSSTTYREVVDGTINHSKGKISFEIYYSDGTKYEDTRYYRNGKIKEITRYKDGAGPWGVKIIERNTEDGKNLIKNGNGINVKWFDDTFFDQSSIGDYKNGLRSGKWKWFYGIDYSLVKSEGIYKEGFYDGTWIDRFKNQKIKAIRNYSNNNWIGIKHGQFKTFFNTGSLRSEGRYKDNKKYGKWIYYDKNGKKTKIKEFSTKLYKTKFSSQ